MQEYISQASRELYRARSLSISPLTALSIADVRREEREKRENERRKRIVEQETYCMPVVPKSPPLTTEKLVACILTEDLYIDKTASSNSHVMNLILEAIEELGRMPTLIVVSKLHYIANEKLFRRFKCHYCEIPVPIMPAPGYAECNFDVRVYGMRI
jgi:hypothetical protein